MKRIMFLLLLFFTQIDAVTSLKGDVSTSTTVGGIGESVYLSDTVTVKIDLDRRT